MTKCRRCGKEAYNHKVCSVCLNIWSEMRGIIWDYHNKKYGKLSPDNLKIRQEETKKLDRLWKKDKEAFHKTIANI